MEQRVLELLKESEALLEGHFLLSSGKHSDKYVQCAKLLMYPEKAEEVCKVIKRKLEDANVKVDAVVGPAMGGIVIAYELGRALGVRAMFTERENEMMTLRRGFFINEGENVLVVEDVVTTGKSSFETVDVVEKYGAKVNALTSIVNRSSVDEINGLKLISATKLEIETFDPDNLPEDLKDTQAVKPGSRK